MSWSQEFARGNAPAAPAHTAPGFAQPGEETSSKATLAMVVGGLLVLARIYYMTVSSTAGASSGYRTGAVVGQAIGMFLCAWLFAWGLTRREGNDAFDESQMFPIAIGITVVGLALGSSL